MGILAWLGLAPGDETKNLDAILSAIARAMPDVEPVVHRYVAVVVVLLGRVAYADRAFTEAEERTLRRLLTEVDRLSDLGVDTMCELLRSRVAAVTEHEVSLCYRELKAICDGKERLAIAHLLVEIAAADGAASDAEIAAVRAVAEGLGIPSEEVEPMIHERLRPAGEAGTPAGDADVAE